MDLPSLGNNLSVLQNIAEMECIGIAWLKKGNDYYQVIIKEYDNLGAMVCIPFDLTKYETITISQANMNRFHSKKQRIETNLVRVVKTILEFPTTISMNKVLQKLGDMRKSSSDEEL
ncbi:hypothetical protein Trydic_g4622 [Trypoxylus dichotomus]